MTSLRLFRARRMLAIPVLSLLASGCAGLGSHVAGSFSCRAPTGDCAPSHVIDARATDELGRSPAPTYDAARKRAGVGGSDAARTAERTIRIVFPAHVDEAGVLHDESVAWAVVERPQWTGTMRAQDHAGQPSAMRTMRRQLKNAQARGIAAAPRGQDDPAGMTGEANLAESLAPIADGYAAGRAIDAEQNLPADMALPHQTLPFQLASPLPLPSSVAEAMPGAPAPAAGGSDLTSDLNDRVPRQSIEGLRFPSAAVIEAAKAKAAEAKRRKAEAGHANSAPAAEAAPQPAPNPADAPDQEKR